MLATRSICLTATVAALLGGDALGGDSASTVGSASEIAELWRPDQRLWVKGNVGLPAAALDRLERWLDVEAPNWTVVILENAAGETYRAADGRNYSGMDAVEYALGSGLPNKTGFGELRDARTGEKNGASFAIFIKERKFSYAGAEAFDARGLGEEHWVGHLDRPAFQAMSNGGRLVDAVTGTVAEIEGRLTRAIALEQRRRQEQALRAERRRAEARAAVAQAAEDVAALESRAKTFRSEHAGVVGDLANPKQLHWRAQAESAKALLDSGRGAEAVSVASEIGDFSRAYANALARYPEASLKFEDLNRAIAELNPQRGGWGATQLEEARRALARAQAAHTRGESAYEDRFRAAEAAYYSANEEIARAKSELDRRIASETEVAAAAERRAATLRRSGIAGGVALGGGAIGMGVLMSRRRRTFKEEAHQTLARWERKFGDSRDRLFGLLDRANLVIGSEDELGKRGYSGQTERLSREVIRDVDRLFVMSVSVDRVIDEAGLQANPKYGFQRIHNLFGTSRYRRAVALLKDLPISFRPEDGVDPIRREGGETGRPLGKLESQEAFSLTFEQLVEQFSDLCAIAKGKLDRIEGAWAAIDSALGAEQSAIDRASKAAVELGARAEADELFPLAGLRDELLASAQADLDQAISTGQSDPVGALEGPLPMARRKAAAAGRICSIVDETREGRMPLMRDDALALEGAGRATRWIERLLRERSDRVAVIVSDAVNASVIGEIERLESDLDGLQEDVSVALDLARRSREKTQSAINVATASVSAGRDALSKELQLPASELLREEGLDPDIRIAGAEEQQAAAMLALDRGGVAAAQAALAEAESLCEESNALVEVSQRSASEHAAERELRRDAGAALRNEVPAHRKLVDAMREAYALSALIDGAGLGTSNDDEAEDVGDLLRRAEDLIAGAEATAEAADACRGRGELIEAASLLGESADALSAARSLLETVREHDARLRRAETENRSRQEQLGAERDSLRIECEDRRTRQSTIASFEAAGRTFEALLRASRDAKIDPFAQARDLAEIDRSFARIAAMLANDRDLFEEAGRSMAEAASHLAVAKRLSHQAGLDQIPDSRRTLELQEEIEKLVLAERAVERRLRVAHEDWMEIDAEADRISLSAGRYAAELRGELERAQAAVTAISAAAGAVREAGSWVGDYGVRVEGLPGSPELHRARDFLLSGRYLETRRLADDARRGAHHAIALARSEVARRRREEQQRAEEARRRRAARQRASNSFGGSRIGSGSRGGSFGGSRSMGSSGSSRSSFGGGSGMSRSGW